MQRGGLESLRVAGVNRSTTLLVRLCYVAMRLKTTQERVWDTTANKPVLLLRLPPLTLVAGLGLSIVESDELSDLVALIREEMIVTVLTLTMVANNKEVGMYFKPDQTPFPEHMTKRHRDFAKRMQDARKKKK